MPLIRGAVRALSVGKQDFLTVLNREWSAVLGRILETVNLRMGFVRSVTADYTALLDDQYILVTAGAVVTVTLPSASVGKMRLTVKRLSASHNVLISPDTGDRLEGTSGSITLSAQYDALDVVSDGATDWWLVSSG